MKIRKKERTKRRRQKERVKKMGEEEKGTRIIEKKTKKRESAKSMASKPFHPA